MECPIELHCASCGRPFDDGHRRGGEGNIVKYCSKKCRSDKREKKQKELETIIIQFLEKRGTNCCPSDIARQEYPNEWKAKMEDIRCAARRLHLRGSINITQKKRVVDSLNFKGPIRLSLTS